MPGWTWPPLAEETKRSGEARGSMELEGKVIEISNLTVHAGERPAVNRFSARLMQGTFTVLTGPDGAGKSTVLRAICRDVEWSEGDILADGLSLRCYPPRPFILASGFPAEGGTGKPCNANHLHIGHRLAGLAKHVPNCTLP